MFFDFGARGEEAVSFYRRTVENVTRGIVSVEDGHVANWGLSFWLEKVRIVLLHVWGICDLRAHCI